MAPTEAQPGLEPIESSATAARYLQYSVEFNLPLTLHLGESETSFEAKAASFDPGTFTLVVEIIDEEFHALVKTNSDQKFSEQKIRISFSLDEIVFFAKSFLTGHKLSHYALGISPPIYKLQRRETLRIRITDEFKASVTILGKKWPLADLSVGGLGFFVPVFEQDQFPVGFDFPKSSLEFLGKSFPVVIRVMSAVLVRQNKLVRIKVGMQFLNLPPSVEQVIAKEAYVYSQKLWSKMT